LGKEVFFKKLLYNTSVKKAIRHWEPVAHVYNTSYFGRQRSRGLRLEGNPGKKKGPNSKIPNTRKDQQSDSNGRAPASNNKTLSSAPQKKSHKEFRKYLNDSKIYFKI
jgi:hypothetical protein